MKPVLAALALSTLVLLAGCGGTSAEDDPFVGTWRPVGGTDASGSLVIAKGSGGYEAFLVSKKPALAMGPMLLRRHGNQLVFGVMSSSSADCTHGECRLEECTWCLLNPRVRPQAPTKVHAAIRRDVPRGEQEAASGNSVPMLTRVAHKGVGVGVNISPFYQHLREGTHGGPRAAGSEAWQAKRQLILPIRQGAATQAMW
jgi:hypothetical protein